MKRITNPKLFEREIQKKVKEIPYLGEARVLFDEKTGSLSVYLINPINEKRARLLIEILSDLSLRVDQRIFKIRSIKDMRDGIRGLKYSPYVEEGVEGEEIDMETLGDEDSGPSLEVEAIEPPQKVLSGEMLDEMGPLITPLDIPLLLGKEDLWEEDVPSALVDNFIRSGGPHLAAIRNLEEKLTMLFDGQWIHFREPYDYSSFSESSFKKSISDPYFARGWQEDLLEDFGPSSPSLRNEKKASMAYLELFTAIEKDLSIEDLESMISEIKKFSSKFANRLKRPLTRFKNLAEHILNRRKSLLRGRGDSKILLGDNVTVTVREFIPPKQNLSTDIYLPYDIYEEDLLEQMDQFDDDDQFQETLEYLSLMAHYGLERIRAKADSTSITSETFLKTYVDSSFTLHETKPLSKIEKLLAMEASGVTEKLFNLFKFSMIEGDFMYDDSLEIYSQFCEDWVEGSGTESSHYMHGFFAGMGVNGSFAPSDLGHEEGLIFREEGFENAAEGDVGDNYHLKFDDAQQGDTFCPTSPANTNFKTIFFKVYAYGQAMFRALGIKELTLYRGIGYEDWEDGQPPIGGIVKVQSRELSSWSASPVTSYFFGGTLIKARIPVERIFMSPFNAPLQSEIEYVVIGSSDIKAVVIAINEEPEY